MLAKGRKQDDIVDAKEFDLDKTAKRYIEDIAAKLSLDSTTVEIAENIYDLEIEYSSSFNSSVEEVVGAVLYIACRVDRCTATIEEISQYLPVRRSEIISLARDISQEMEFNINKEIISNPQDRVSEYIDRYLQELVDSGVIENVDTEIQDHIDDVTKKYFANHNYSGKKLNGIAASIIYCVLMDEGIDEITQIDVAEVANATPVTIRKNNRTIKDLV